MNELTQAQKTWHMAFNERLRQVVAYTESANHWENAADHARKQRGETDEEIGRRRADCRNQAQRMRDKRTGAENALCDWVILHPYPSNA